MEHTPSPAVLSQLSVDTSQCEPTGLSPRQYPEQFIGGPPVSSSTQLPRARLPPWIRSKLPSGVGVSNIKRLLRTQSLTTVCEEASCPNLGECFNHGTATFMIMGDRCTRRCPFCDVAHGYPAPLDLEEPQRLAAVVGTLGLRYVVLTSVTRDDLRDGGSGHFATCIQKLRASNPQVKVEILVPDFRGRQAMALNVLADNPPDVFNHNLETVPRLYATVRPGANYAQSLALLNSYAKLKPEVPTKSGLMLGLGETIVEIEQVLIDLLRCGCQMLTIGQYLQSSKAHLPVARFVPPEEFATLGDRARVLGFTQVACAPMVRSSYHAEQQARSILDVGTPHAPLQDVGTPHAPLQDVGTPHAPLQDVGTPHAPLQDVGTPHATFKLA